MPRNRRQNRDFWEAATNNNATFRQYYNRFTELAVSMFDWRGMPDTVDTRYLELTLFSYGEAVFFVDEVIGPLCLPCNILGPLNVYGEPTAVTAYSNHNGYTRNLVVDPLVGSEAQGVLIHNNLLHTNSRLDVIQYAKRLYNIDRAIDVNTNAQKTPILITCPQEQLLTLKNVYKAYDGNEPVIYGDNGLSPKGFGVLKTDAPFRGDVLQALKTQLFNEYLTHLGISNMNFIKKERLISDEVLRSQGSTMASRYSRLVPRQTAADEIKRLFGIDVSCSYREDVTLAVERTAKALGEETYGEAYSAQVGGD